ncbi:MAG: N-acetylmuramoyl-L-alanine amidase [Frankiaceae bacterium]|jgi:N-acetylmuramoyl-L-alanine amidase|nr:N-acetylmuramoyl-L-alanine amidase [Frankiaceae bacterium]
MTGSSRSSPICSTEVRERRTRARLLLVVVLLAGPCLAACTSSGGTPSAAPSPTLTPTSSPPTAPASTPPVTPSPTTTPAAIDYGGQGVRWPRVARSAPPPALGAVVTLDRVQRGDGGTLAAGLTLPRVGGTAAAPVVLTPCGTRTLVTGSLRRIPPSGPHDVLVVIDPGHGGRAEGTHAPDGTREKDVVLDLARRAAVDLRGRVGRVVLTRDRDLEATIGFRVALADALRADLALSVHLNASPETTRSSPGTSAYGSVADPAGRRAAGVVYASVRHYLEQWTPTVRRWAANPDSGALYRLGRNGQDYYGLLRQAHVTWVIAESAYLSAPREAALLARPAVRAGLAGALADGVVAVTSADTPGSGWRRPLTRPADPPAPPLPGRCVDPA